MMKLRAVFFGGGHANQVLTPNGKYGTLYVGVGGGGAPAEDLYLWQSGENAGIMDKVQLESVFKESILDQVSKWNSRTPFSPGMMDKAFNQGSYQDFPGLIDGSEFPMQGYWELKLRGTQSVVVYHHYLPNDSFIKLYKMEYFENNGWKLSLIHI